MKARTIIRARAKGAAQFYAQRGFTEALVVSFNDALRRKLPHDCMHDWFVHVYTDKDYPEEFIGFKSETEAKSYAHDVTRFVGELLEAA